MDDELVVRLRRAGEAPLTITAAGIVARARSRHRRRLAAIAGVMALVLVPAGLTVLRGRETEEIVLSQQEPPRSPAAAASTPIASERPLVPDLPPFDPDSDAAAGLPPVPDHPALSALAEATAPEGVLRTDARSTWELVPPYTAPDRRGRSIEGGVLFDAGDGRSAAISYLPLDWLGDLRGYFPSVAEQESDVRLVTLPDLAFGLVEERVPENFTLQFALADLFVSMTVQGRAGEDGDRPPLTVDQALAWAAAMRREVWWGPNTDVARTTDDGPLNLPAGEADPECQEAFRRVTLPGAYGTFPIDPEPTLDFCEPAEWLAAAPAYADGLPGEVWGDPEAWRAARCTTPSEHRACPEPG